MFSLDRFYYILHNNLISNFTNSKSVFFEPFGTYNNTRILANPYNLSHKSWTHVYFYDQEPLYDDEPLKKYMFGYLFVGPTRINIIANSEKSKLKDQIFLEKNFQDWYYFFHGFAALDWYRDFQYVKQESFEEFTSVFICYNHLTSKYRSYRLHLVSNLINQDLIKYGKVSLFLDNWRETIEDPNSPLNPEAKITIFNALKNVKESLTIDTTTPDGTLSANVDLAELTSSFFHIVTETIYFLPKLHLTEKIFKPIIAQRPFILVAAPGNLAYLKSYGFKTFDHWIDESYDQEQDNYLRIEKITKEIERICLKSPEDLKKMHNEMKEILKFNYDHFYNEFKNIIVNELVDNFSTVLANNNLSCDHLAEAKLRLLK